MNPSVDAADQIEALPELEEPVLSVAVEVSPVEVLMLYLALNLESQPSSLGGGELGHRVVAGARVEADYLFGLSNEFLEFIQVKLNVLTVRLFIGLDH